MLRRATSAVKPFGSTIVRRCCFNLFRSCIAMYKDPFQCPLIPQSAGRSNKNPQNKRNHEIQCSRHSVHFDAFVSSFWFPYREAPDWTRDVLSSRVKRLRNESLQGRLGACGGHNGNNDLITAIGIHLFQSAKDGGDSNNNPFCGRKIKVTHGDFHRFCEANGG